MTSPAALERRFGPLIASLPHRLQFDTSAELFHTLGHVLDTQPTETSDAILVAVAFMRRRRGFWGPASPVRSAQRPVTSHFNDSVLAGMILPWVTSQLPGPKYGQRARTAHRERLHERILECYNLTFPSS